MSEHEWKSVNWKDLIAEVMINPRVTAGVRLILDAVAKEGIGDAEHFRLIAQTLEESAFHRSRLHQITRAILECTTEWLADVAAHKVDAETVDPQKLADQVYFDVASEVRILSIVHLVMGILAGLKAADTIMLWHKEVGDDGQIREGFLEPIN